MIWCGRATGKQVHMFCIHYKYLKKTELATGNCQCIPIEYGIHNSLIYVTHIGVNTK